jgi:hypothetical protein
MLAVVELIQFLSFILEEVLVEHLKLHMSIILLFSNVLLSFLRQRLVEVQPLI